MHTLTTRNLADLELPSLYLRKIALFKVNLCENAKGRSAFTVQETMTVALVMPSPANMPGYKNSNDLDEVSSLTRYCFSCFCAFSAFTKCLLNCNHVQLSVSLKLVLQPLLWTTWNLLQDHTRTAHKLETLPPGDDHPRTQTMELSRLARLAKTKL